LAASIRRLRIKNQGPAFAQTDGEIQLVRRRTFWRSKKRFTRRKRTERHMARGILGEREEIRGTASIIPSKKRPHRRLRRTEARGRALRFGRWVCFAEMTSPDWQQKNRRRRGFARRCFFCRWSKANALTNENKCSPDENSARCCNSGRRQPNGPAAFFGGRFP